MYQTLLSSISSYSECKGLIKLLDSELDISLISRACNQIPAAKMSTVLLCRRWIKSSKSSFSSVCTDIMRHSSWKCVVFYILYSENIYTCRVFLFHLQVCTVYKGALHFCLLCSSHRDRLVGSPSPHHSFLLRWPSGPWNEHSLVNTASPCLLYALPFFFFSSVTTSRK